MKIIAYSSCSLLKPAVGVLLDESLIHTENGDEVHFVYCDKVLKSCSYNLEHNSLLCNYCQSENKRLFHKYLVNTSIEVHCLSEFHLIKSEPTFDYTTVEEVKALIYKGVEVGVSCLSSYISTTRNSLPRIDDSFKSFFNPLLRNACVAVNNIISMLDNINPDKVLLFNGRLFDVNATIAICKQRGIPFTCLEVADLEGKRYKQYYENTVPHDPVASSNMIEKFWQEDYITLEEKKKIGEDFFVRRRNGRATNDNRIYTASQKRDSLPENFDVTKRNFAIFNSSEDELASLGKQFESKNLFPTQLEGIKYVLDSVKDNLNIHFYLRVHPNLAKIGFSYHTDLYKLPEVYNNITVIGANEQIDSYALMEACEKVIAFTSSMGIESVYWKKPVIILGNTFYYDLNGFYKPTKISQIHQLLVEKLDSLDNSDSIKYGFFLMAKNPHRRFKYVDFDFYTVKLPKFTAITANYQKWFNSRYFFSIRNLIILSIVRGINKILGRGKK